MLPVDRINRSSKNKTQIMEERNMGKMNFVFLFLTRNWMLLEVKDKQ